MYNRATPETLSAKRYVPVLGGVSVPVHVAAVAPLAFGIGARGVGLLAKSTVRTRRAASGFPVAL